MIIQGSIVALVTPFTKEGEIDTPTLEKLASWHVEEGTDAIVCLGTTGEVSTLTEEEQTQIVETVVKTVDGRIPVIVGTGSNCTKHTLLRTEKAQKLGASGCLVIVPYYNRPSFEGCYAHFKEVSQIGLPMIVYHHPKRTGLKLSVENLAEICELPGICGVKEGSTELSYTIELQSLSTVPIFSGDDDLTLPLISIGAKGVISIIANIIPTMWRNFVHNCLQNEMIVARERFQQYYRLCRSLVLENNPQCVKYALAQLGIIEPIIRLPLVLPKESTQLEIDQALEEMGLIPRDSAIFIEENL